MTDNDLILKGCAADWNEGIQTLARKVRPGLYDSPNYAPSIHDLEAAQQFVNTIKKLTNDLEEVLTRYHKTTLYAHPHTHNL